MKPHRRRRPPGGRLELLPCPGGLSSRSMGGRRTLLVSAHPPAILASLLRPDHVRPPARVHAIRIAYRRVATRPRPRRPPSAVAGAVFRLTCNSLGHNFLVAPLLHG